MPTHLAPHWVSHPLTKDTYYLYNRPLAIMHWLHHAPPIKQWILVSAYDRLFLRFPATACAHRHNIEGDDA